MDDIGAITETAGAAALEIAVSAVRERGGKVGHCANCEAPMIGPYCAACGQPLDTHRRSVLELAHDFIKDIASFDSRILKTVWALLFRPGELPLAYREGRTQRYVPAVRLYLFMSLIFFVTLSAAGVALLQLELVKSQVRFVADKNHDVYVITNGVRAHMGGFKAGDKGNVYLAAKGVPAKLMPGMKADGRTENNITTIPHFFTKFGAVKINPVLQSAVASDVRKDTKDVDPTDWFDVWVNTHVGRMETALAMDPSAINEPLTEWIPRILFILLPLFALVLALFYRRQRKKYFFVDHLVFSLNYHAFGFAALLVAAGLAQFMPGGVVAQILLLWLAVYLFLALKRFYAQGWVWTSVKFASVGFVYVTFIFLPAFGAIILLSLTRI